MLLATALLIVGLLLVVYSADRLVFAASILCRTFGIPPLIIGMTVVSIGTSLPEIIVSLAASLHEQRDLAVGTALGSNIINILLILGLAALVRPFTVHSDVLRRELPLMLLVSVVAGSVLYDGQLSRSDGIFLLFLRSNFACIRGDISPISSNSTEPPFACSKNPFFPSGA